MTEEQPYCIECGRKILKEDGIEFFNLCEECYENIGVEEE